MWNKTLKQNKSRRGVSVNQSNNFAQQQQHCCLVNITSYVTSSRRKMAANQGDDKDVLREIAMAAAVVAVTASC